MKINFDLLFLISIPITLVLVYFVNRKFRIFDTWISTIKKLGPLFMTFFPVSFTYFFVCGSFSAVMVGIYILIRGKENMDRDEFLTMEKIVEYLCSFLMPLLYFRICTKRGFSEFWIYIITITHMLAAGYRDAKFIYEPSTTKPGEMQFESGPQILHDIQIIDAVIPLIALLVFLFILRNKWKIYSVERLNETQPV